MIATRRSVARAAARAAASLAALALPVAAAAQATPDAAAPPLQVSSTVVVTSTLAPVSLDAVSRTTTIVTRQDLAAIGVDSIVDALRLVPGVDARARGPEGVQTDFSIRGATFGQNLVLVDGIRLNDAQTGHHNGEIPMAVAGIDRIEVVAGAGSAVHGADALGGTINVISRRGRYAEGEVEGGQYGYVSAQGSVSGVGLPDDWAVTGWASRSSGFTADRDFAQGGVALRGDLRPGLTVDVRHTRRAFGAAGFYGDSPSKEWTNLTLGAATWQHDVDGWTVVVHGDGRHHADHFRWDINRPGYAENLHHTNAIDARVTATRDLGHGRRLTVGSEDGGDWVVSSNLGDHHYAHGSGFAEILWPVASRTTVQAGVRAEAYSTFGHDVSPSISAVTRVSRDLRLRASAGHAFRIPTFTELYYTDPANLGTPDLRAEHGWSVDGGADWTRGPWTLSFSPFRRWDRDVIDWVRATPADLWRSANIRDVTSTGFEASLTRRWEGALLRVYYAGLTVDAPTLDLLSKYVNEYARHQSGGSLAVPIGTRFGAAVNVDHRHRNDGQSYDLVSVRVTHHLRRADLFIAASNLLDEDYHEIIGVPMPGRWVTVGVTVR
jgi:iron complex outermembrane receptor protein